ncbi:magnesium/cobalt transporter CorA [Cytobacillus firmus]|uniref:Magnesium transport protein CorA n=1 Tax=Cytobacillus firmus TaxID=1399 RepID=A0AA46SJ91_CYTFI|nr:magnesium/cobalt transporter CorA [Cytobacillus firmus]MBY6052872.1 magnesium/cobalt transporter CorA [Cytobacillus firmus]URT69263.1 magnesium/cobalt transporter CorA [Cytobacillus firmus]UYG95094.1 magnesium/cobalt transporter CorA [Cytobacillus firmus]WHY60156.1 magnesium/cobalt transporter CorA [Cytobacillus firmus]
MIRIQAVNKKNELKQDITLERLKAEWESYKWFWVDFDQPTEEETAELDKTFHFHPLAIEDCVVKLQRPKMDYYEDYSFFVTHSLNHINEDKQEINFFIGSNYIVSYHHELSREMNDVWERLSLSKKISKWDPYLVMYHIIDKIVDNYFPIVYQLEDRLSLIEDNPNDETMEELLEKLFDIRHHLLQIRYTVIPMRDLIYRVINSHRLKGVKERYEYFADIHDHLLKLTEMIDGNRELTNDIRDSYLSINSHQTNRVMRVLTVITTIFMPLTFIAGIYGMNFENMPELSWKYGYFETLLLMFIIALGMFWWFMKKGWFR